MDKAMLKKALLCMVMVRLCLWSVLLPAEAPEPADRAELRLVLLPLVPRSGVSDAEAQTVTMLIASSIAVQGDSFITIIEPPKNEAILSEQMFRLSGLAADDSAMEFGRRMNANMLLTGFCARLEGELTAAVLLFDVESGRAVAGRTSTLREATLFSDLALFTGELLGDLRRSGEGVSGNELEQLVSLGRTEEALRLLPLADPGDETAAAVEERLRSLRSGELGRVLAGGEVESGREAERLFLLFVLSGDDEEARAVAEKVFADMEERRRAEVKKLLREHDAALKAGDFERAGGLLLDLELLRAAPALLSALREEGEQARLGLFLKSSRAALFRGAAESASFYGYKAMEIDPLNETALERTIEAEERKEKRTMQSIASGSGADPFSPSYRGEPLLELSFGYGASGDALAKLAARGTGASGSVALFLYRRVLDPVERELGGQISVRRREGGIASSSGGACIDVESLEIALTVSAGLAVRFYRLDAGARVRGGAILFTGSNNSAPFTVPGVTFSPELYGRYFPGRGLFFGAALSFPSAFTAVSPAVGGVEFSLASGWNF